MLYDRDCGFCRWSLAQLLVLDRRRRLCPVALDTEEANAVLAGMEPAERVASWHLVAPDGRRWSAGAAGPPLLRLLPGGQIPAAVLTRAPRVTERAYRWVADHRSALSRLLPDRSKARADARIAASTAVRQDASSSGSCTSR